MPKGIAVQPESIQAATHTAGAATGRLTLVIPALDEAGTILRVLDRVLAVPLPVEREVIVVDDGSSVRTADLVLSLGHPEVKLLRHKTNQGKGAAIRTALAHATGDLLLIQDADLEYAPEVIPSLLAALVDSKADAVYGSRFLGTCEGMRLPNRIGNWVLARAATLLYGHRITDEATAYKLFRTEVLRSLPLRCRGFEFCPEVTGLLLRGGYRLVEAPIAYRARTHKEGKKIGWRDGVQALWTLPRCRLGR
ncbi:MAG TPA: glycosyltransferase family 2 protein [Armatimonadota bacterium]|jgi:glycosyltransferase involved in cell wall biosynthesis